MALKATEEQRLDKFEFDKFFEKNREHYLKLAQDAYDYTAKILRPASIPPRQDDVGDHLCGALEVDARLTKYREGKRCNAAYWVRYFANLVLDQLWPDVSSGQQPVGGSQQAASGSQQTGGAGRIRKVRAVPG